MPIETTFVDNKGVIGTASGPLSGSDVIQFNSEMYASLDFVSKLQYKLMDYRDVTTINVTMEDLKTIAEQDIVASNWNKNLRIAVVIKRELQQSLVKIWQGYTLNSNLISEIFDNLDDAKQWVESASKA